MVEVFKTNVDHIHQAGMLIACIHQTFEGYVANFDLDDCDKILRVKSSTGYVDAPQIIRLLTGLGFYAEILVETNTHNQHTQTN